MQRELVEAARGGDHDAFEVLAAAAVDRLYAVARLILRDTHDAEDAVQAALTDAWRNLPRLREPDRFDAWLHRLLINACSDVRRHRRRFEAHIRVVHLEPAEADVSSTFADHEQLERGFRRLKPDHRVVVVLHFYLGLTFQEIANVVGIPVGTAKSRVFYATGILRAALEADARHTLANIDGRSA
jgi:RNA polymerase sigma-70 factor (ECF subfamily)